MRHNPSHISHDHPEVLALSDVLNRLPIHQTRPDEEVFRNKNGVYMKMCNFLRFDPTYEGTGLRFGGKLEEQIWNEFSDNPKELHRIADDIKAMVNSLESVSLHVRFDDEAEAQEGAVLFRLHRVRERKSNLVDNKKKSVLAKKGILECEVCTFDFQPKYGELGQGYIECHHIVPLSEPKPEQRTRLSNLALVCANCHRMLHKCGKSMSIDTLRKIVRVR